MAGDTPASDPALMQRLEQLRQQVLGLEAQMAAGLPPPIAVTVAPGCAGCMSEMGMVTRSPASAAGPPLFALPGFPGASHLYHLGADGFFLGHTQYLALVTDQKARLGSMRERALLALATADREIEDEEQRLFVLTGADQPDASIIETQIRRIEALRTARRLAYIRSVGEAALVLTDQQRSMLLGAIP